jgi:hypothetical protein
MLLGQWASPAQTAAQGSFETIGTRAQGMGGAFVAVADDATATYWNPAGLGAIPIFDASLTYAESERTDTAGTPTFGVPPAWRTRASSFAIALPVIGVSYYSLRATRARAAGAVSRTVAQEANTAFAGETTGTWNLGVTLVQSLGDAVVVGGTLRLVRGGAAVATVLAGEETGALDATDDLNERSETKLDADLGLMAYVGRARIGLAVRTLVAPTWDAGETMAVETDRLVRVGVAWGPDPVRGRRRWSIATDADLTTAEGLDGDRRALAVGAERWFRTGRMAIRGGARAQTTGNARPVATGGASLGVLPWLMLEGQVTAGGDTVERGWGLGARATF